MEVSEGKCVNMKFGIIALLVLFLSCKKDKSCESCNTEAGYVNAKIIYAGPIETDGCDWLIQIGDKYYRADQLDATFKQNELNVRICYETTTDKFICGIGALGIPIIHVIDVKK